MIKYLKIHNTYWGPPDFLPTGAISTILPLLNIQAQLSNCTHRSSPCECTAVKVKQLRNNIDVDGKMMYRLGSAIVTFTCALILT